MMCHYFWIKYIYTRIYYFIFSLFLWKNSVEVFKEHKYGDFIHGVLIFKISSFDI
jgi:hypothetical protein